MPNGGGHTYTDSVSVIGVGGAGCTMLHEVSDMLSATGVDITGESGNVSVEAADIQTTVDAASLVAIDSNHEDLQANSPSAATPIHLDATAFGSEYHRNMADYLPEEPNVPLHTIRSGHHGCLRDRRFGRYLAEQNSQRIEEKLRSELVNLAEKTRQSNDSLHQVWVVNSLNGGTGSGAALVVATIARRIASDVFSHFVVGGLGSYLPPDEHGPPFGRQSSNPYTTLRELSSLQVFDEDNSDAEDLYPVTFGTETHDTDALELEERPFELYGLVEAENTYVSDPSESFKSANRTVADTIAAALIQPRCHPYEYSKRRYGGSIFRWHHHSGFSGLHEFEWFKISSLQFASPVATVREYCETERDIDSVEDELTDLRSTLESLDDERTTDGATSDLSRSTCSERLTDDTQDDIRNAVSELSADVSTQRVERFEDEIIENGDTGVDGAIAGYCYYHAVTGLVEEKLADTGFAELLKETAVQTMEDDVEVNSNTSPLEQWRNTVRPDLDAEIERLDRRYDQTTPIRLLRRRRLRDELERLRERRESVSEAAEKWERIDEIRNRCLKNRDEYLDRIRETVAEHETTVEELEAKRERLQTENRDQAMMIRNGMVTPRVDFSELECDFEDVPHLHELCNRNVVDSSDLELFLREAVDRDVTGVVDGPRINSATIDILLTNESNWGRATECSDDIKFRADSGRVDWFEIPTAHAIRALRLWGLPGVDSLRAYDEIDTNYTEEEGDTSEHVGVAAGESEVTTGFAYPEFVEIRQS